MQQCQIHDGSLKFSRAVYGILVLIAVIIHSEWLVLAASILVILGAISLKLNIAYQFYILVLKKILNDKAPLVLKESGELSFVWRHTFCHFSSVPVWSYNGIIILYPLYMIKILTPNISWFPLLINNSISLSNTREMDLTNRTV